MFYQIDVLKNFARCKGKHLCRSLFSIRMQVFSLHFCKKEIPAQMFPVNFTKILRIPCYRTPQEDGFSELKLKLSAYLQYTEIIETFSSQQFSLKVGLLLFKKNCFICFNDGRSKMMKNAFYFILKALSVLKIFKFLS